MTRYSLSDIAAALDADLFGDPDIEIDAAAQPADAGPGDLALAMDEKYAGGLAYKSPDAFVAERLVRLPREERHRVKIISDFIGPSKRSGRLVLRNPPELLRRMIEVAELSPNERERLLVVVDETPYETKKKGS